MYKLLILFLPPLPGQRSSRAGKSFWDGRANAGLRKEVVSDIDELVFGPSSMNYKKIHELYFDSREELEAALTSEAGQKAGQWLQSFTQGRFF